MAKSRLSTRLKDKTGIAKSKNRSEDLVGLRTKYAQFTKNLKFLISTLTNNHAAMMSYSKSRLEVAKAINSLTVDTPLFKCAGDIPATAVGTTDGGDKDSTSEAGSSSTNSGVGGGAIPYQATPTSYAAIHLQLHKKHKLYADKYTEHILNYATEWERILSTRIAGHLKQSEKLRVDLDHYGRKVEDLNKTMNKAQSKGKDGNVDKLKRNESKLVQARQEYDRFVNDLCGFMEEIMDRGWKDLHPLLVKMAQFDSTLSNEEAMLLKGNMASVTEQMKGMGAKYPNLKPTGRLKELETWSLESLNKINPSMRSSGSGEALMIMQGGGEAAGYVTGVGETGGNSTGIHAGLGGAESNDELNNNVGGGGLFGSATGQQMSRTGSFASNAGSDHGGAFQPRSRNDTGDSYDWTTGGAAASNISINQGSIGRSSSYRAAPSSGGLPPLNPNNRAGSFHNMNTSDMSALTNTNTITSAPPPSLNDVFGGGMMAAPPPAGMPPPPPSMPPPPVPQSLSPQVSALSLYDNNGGGSMSNLQPHHQIPPPAPVTGSPFMTSPSARSSASSTNPFDDAPGPGAYGGAVGGMMAGHPPAAAGGRPSYGNPSTYGGGGGASTTSTNPFG